MKTPLESAGTGPPPPGCVFVTGPRGAGKTRWLQQRLRALAAEEPGRRVGVVLAEEGRTRMEPFARQVTGVAVRRVLLACPCCPARAFLPDTVRQLAAESGARWIFIESPAMAAAGLLREFDRELGWPREVVLALDERWERLRQGGSPPPFLTAILAAATLILPPRGGTDPSPGRAPPAGDVPHLTLR